MKSDSRIGFYVEDNRPGVEYVEYYSSGRMTWLIVSTLLASLPVGPFMPFLFMFYLYWRWPYIQGYREEKKYVNRLITGP